jgi:hypothetical protein
MFSPVTGRCSLTARRNKRTASPVSSPSKLQKALKENVREERFKAGEISEVVITFCEVST